MKKNFECITAILISLLLFFSVACNNNGDGPDEGNSSTSGNQPIVFTDIKLTNEGKSDYVIVIPENADECVSYAAEELQKYFKESTTANIVIEKDTGKHFNKDVKYISLGNTTLKDEAEIPNAVKQEVNLDGFKLIRKNNSIFIVGYMSRGVLFGVYTFMGYTIGYECYAMDEISLNYNKTVYLPDVNLTEKPSFESRWIDGPIARTADFAINARIRSGFNAADLQYGGNVKDEWLFGANVHCEFRFFTEDGYDGTIGYRPDVLTPDTLSVPGGYHLCWTSEKAIDLVVERAIRQLQAQPTALYVNIAEEDNATYCNCERADTSFCGMGCKESREKFGSSGTLIRFANQIVEGIEAWREIACPEREIKYATLAYSGNIVPPVTTNDEGEIVVKDESCIPHDKLYVKFAPLGRCCLHAFNDENCAMNKGKASNWEGWKIVTNGRLMVYDYLTDFTDYYTFFNNYNVVQEEMITYYEDGVVNYAGQYTSGASFSSMSDLNNYLFTELMWNVYADSNKLIENFMNAYYKEGAPYMMEYFNLMRTHIDNKAANDANFHVTNYAAQHTPYYSTVSTWPKAVLQKALSLIEQADKVYEQLEDTELKAKLKARILKESFCVRFIFLRNYGKYYSYASPEYVVFKEQWSKDALELSANYWGEGDTIASFISNLP